MRASGRWAIAATMVLACACGGGKGTADPGPADVPGEIGADAADPGGIDAPDAGDPGPRDVPAEEGDAPDGTADPALTDPGTDGEPDPGAEVADVLPDESPEDLVPDPAGDPGPDAAPDNGPTDAAFADPPPDAAADAPEAADPGGDACPALACPAPCPFGNRPDADGCATCDCRECNAPEDCPALPGCLLPWCDPDGTCTCDCGTAPVPVVACPGGAAIEACACGPLGWTCSPHPEYRCPTLCRPGETAALPCPDGSTAAGCACPEIECVPQCRAVGTELEGWYDGCSEQFLTVGRCDGCRLECREPGTAGEGWWESCTGRRLTTGPCAPRYACDAAGIDGCADPRCTGDTPAADWTCPDGAKVPWCACGGANLWSCASTPWDACPAAAPCTAIGDGFATGAGTAGCCPGGLPAPEVPWDGAACGMPTGRTICTACGDGACVAPETPCTCPTDCAGATGAPGDPCRADGDCGDGWSCLAPADGTLGACARPCVPPTPGQKDPCPDGMACLALQGFVSPGFCLRSCDGTHPCPTGLSCGASVSVLLPPAAGCYPWPSCDPGSGRGCGPLYLAQCRIDGGAPACGAPGTVDLGEPCDPALDRCAAGLACWTIPPTPQSGLCSPVCQTDADCTRAYWDACFRGDPGDAWGRCGLVL